MQITHLGILNSDAFIVKEESLEYHFFTYFLLYKLHVTASTA